MVRTPDALSGRPAVVVLIEAYLPIRGGAQNNLQELCRRLGGRGVRCDVLTRRYTEELPPREQVDGVTIWRYGLCRVRVLAKLRWAAAAVSHLWRRRNEYDLVLSVPIFYWPDLLPAALNRLLTGRPYVVRTTLAGNFGAMLSWSAGSSTDFVKHLLFPPPLWRRILAGAAAVVAQSELLQQRARGLGLPACRLIPNGVDTERFAVAEDEDRRGLRRTLGLSPEAVIVICTARFVVDKNQIVLLEAMERLLRRADAAEAMLLLLGIEEFNLALANEEQLRRFVSTHAMEEQVRMLRDVDNVEDYLRAADVFVLPTKFDEGVSNSVLEAMSCGLPVICSDLPQLRSMFPAGEGLFFDPDDVDALYAQLCAVMALPDLGASRGRVLAEHIRATQAIERTVDSWETLIRETAGEVPAASEGGSGR